MFENVPAFIPMLFGAAGCLICLAPTMLLFVAGAALSLAIRHFGRKDKPEGDSFPATRRRRYSGRRRTQAAHLDYNRYVNGQFADYIQH